MISFYDGNMEQKYSSKNAANSGIRKFIFAITLFGALFLASNSASAKGIIFYSNGEKIEMAKQLPDSAIVNDEHVNLGVMYKQFSIFWVPVWNYGETRSDRSEILSLR